MGRQLRLAVAVSFGPYDVGKTLVGRSEIPRIFLQRASKDLLFWLGALLV